MMKNSHTIRTRIVMSVFIFIAVYYISRHWFQIMLIQGNSMYPSYHNMQFVIVSRIEQDYYYAGDVIVFRCDGFNSVLVKRVVASSGDVVSIEAGTLKINGLASEIYPETGIFNYAGELEKPIYLGEGQYIVIGDNIAESKDSRYWQVGIVGEESILGKVILP